MEWDGPNMKVTNIPELNQWLKREDRKGWTADGYLTRLEDIASATRRRRQGWA